MPQTDVLVAWMRKNGVSVTRANYIQYAWLESLPEAWTAEEENMLPENLQDWSLFKLNDTTQELEYIGPPIR